MTSMFIAETMISRIKDQNTHEIYPIMPLLCCFDDVKFTKGATMTQLPSEFPRSYF